MVSTCRQPLIDHKIMFQSLHLYMENVWKTLQFSNVVCICGCMCVRACVLLITNASNLACIFKLLPQILNFPSARIPTIHSAIISFQTFSFFSTRCRVISWHSIRVWTETTLCVICQIRFGRQALRQEAERSRLVGRTFYSAESVDGFV